MGEVAALLPPAYRGAYAVAAPSPGAQRAPGAPDAGSGKRA